MCYVICVFMLCGKVGDVAVVVVVCVAVAVVDVAVDVVGNGVSVVIECGLVDTVLTRTMVMPSALTRCMWRVLLLGCDAVDCCWCCGQCCC